MYHGQFTGAWFCILIDEEEWHYVMMQSKTWRLLIVDHVSYTGGSSPNATPDPVVVKHGGRYAILKYSRNTFVTSKKWILAHSSIASMDSWWEFQVQDCQRTEEVRIIMFTLTIPSFTNSNIFWSSQICPSVKSVRGYQTVLSFDSSWWRFLSLVCCSFDMLDGRRRTLRVRGWVELAVVRLSAL